MDSARFLQMIRCHVTSASSVAAEHEFNAEQSEYRNDCFFPFLAGPSGAIVSMVSAEGAAMKVRCVLTTNTFQSVKTELHAGTSTNISTALYLKKIVCNELRNIHIMHKHYRYLCEK